MRKTVLFALVIGLLAWGCRRDRESGAAANAGKAASPGSPAAAGPFVTVRDGRFVSIAAGGPAAGDNFWAWAGQARPGTSWVGDPPHEPAGWYSVYDTDASTLAIISAHVKEIAGLVK